MAVAAAALTTPPWTLTTYAVISQISRHALGLLLAFSDGPLIGSQLP